MNLLPSPLETSSLTIPARPAYAGLAGVYVAALARHCGFAGELSERLGQSLRLMVEDVLQQAFSSSESKEVQLSCQRLSLGLRIVIREQGLPLAPEELASLGADPGLCPLIDLGGHLACVREVWDEASFHNLGRAGAEVRLLKYLPATGRDPGPEDGLLPPEPVGLSPEEPLSLEVRPFRPADALAVVRLLYRTYGYSYPFENLYFPERLTALNAGGGLQSLVALTSRQELVGHVALFFSPDHPELGELGSAVVDPAFRGHGCLRRLTQEALAEAGRRQLAALFGRPVTNHVYSQKVVADLGFNPCGLLVGFGSASLSFKNIHEQLPQRESMLVIYRSLAPAPPGRIFPPARHREVIMQLYADLGMAPEAEAPGADPLSDDQGAGSLDIHTFPDGGIAFLKVKSIGSETLPEIRRHLRRLCQSRFDAIQLELDLRQPDVCHLVPACEALGFFLAGILPRPHGPQTLWFQYLNNVPIDYGHIQLISPRARQLKEYIRRVDPNAAPLEDG